MRPTKMATILLKGGKTQLMDFYLRNGKSYVATVVMTDDGAKTIYNLDFVKK